MKRLSPKAEKILSVSLGVCLFCLCASLLMPGVFSSLVSPRKIPVSTVNGDYGAVALTFDAVWNSDAETQMIIDALDIYGVKATFFVSEVWARAHSESVRALHLSGHEIMSLGTDGGRMTRLSKTEAARAMAEAASFIESVTGIAPALFRPPGGEYDDRLISAAESAGYTAVLWDADSRNFRASDEGALSRRIAENVAPGSIILYRADTGDALRALPDVIAALLRRGYTPVPAGKALGI